MFPRMSENQQSCAERSENQGILNQPVSFSWSNNTFIKETWPKLLEN